MTFIPALYGTIDANNSTTSTLTANSTFTGTSTIVTNYSQVTVNITCDQISAVNGFSVEFSQDNANWDILRSNSIVIPNPGTANSQTFYYNVEAKYYRIVYVNGTTGQGVFRMQSVIGANRNNAPTIQGMVEGGLNYPMPINATNDNALTVQVNGPSSSFGDFRVVEPTPLVQASFVYGFNSNYFLSTTVTGGTATAANQLGTVTTTTTSASSAIIQTKKYYKYREGQGGLARFTSLFTAGIANNNQIIGVGDTVNGYFFGYNGTSFGILYRNNSVDTWTPQASWNMDTCLGTGGASNISGFKINTVKGNVYQISLAYLGFANILFYIYCPLTDSFIKVHVLNYANLNTATLVTNPSMTIWMQSINTAAAASAISLSTASVALFNDGIVSTSLGAKYGKNSSKATITTQTSIITLQCNATINGGIINKSTISIESVCFTSSAAAGTSAATLFMTLNATLGGTPSYTNIDATNSIASFDVAGTTVTGGTLIRTYVGSFNTTTLVTFSNEILLFPSDIMTFSITNGASATAGVSVNWIENT